MVDYRDVRELTRRFRHGGKEFTVTVFQAENGVFVDTVAVAGMDPIKDRDSDGHPDIEAAFAAGESLGHGLIG